MHESTRQCWRSTFLWVRHKPWEKKKKRREQNDSVLISQSFFCFLLHSFCFYYFFMEEKTISQPMKCLQPRMLILSQKIHIKCWKSIREASGKKRGTHFSMFICMCAYVYMNMCTYMYTQFQEWHFQKKMSLVSASLHFIMHIYVYTHISV